MHLSRESNHSKHLDGQLGKPTHIFDMAVERRIPNTPVGTHIPAIYFTVSN
jgi:hypothetical protein